MFAPLTASWPALAIQIWLPVLTSRAITSPNPSPKYTILPETAGLAQAYPDWDWYHLSCTPPEPGPVESRQDQRITASAANTAIDARLSHKEICMANHMRNGVELSYVR